MGLSVGLLTLGVLNGFLGGITPLWVGLDVNEAVQMGNEAQGEADSQQLGGKLFYRGIGLVAKHPVGDGNDLVDQSLVDELSIGVQFGDFSKNNGLGRVSNAVLRSSVSRRVVTLSLVVGIRARQTYLI